MRANQLAVWHADTSISLGDRVHHPREDVAYARLVERDSGMQVVVNRLLQERRVIAIVGEAL
ncbi:hypothetical protein [Cupriavidus necator]|uniref:hypothetical protein n=1 Tax=Cupriavidus necator TaxID=106590 RepID=UPI000AECFE86|nr:hypothetical protein [Cupriavidus necator]